MSAGRTWLIGESNPYGGDPRYALYPEPPNSAGGRLCRLVMRMEPRDYLRAFERRNLLAQGRWSAPEAREVALRLLAEIPETSPVVLLGARVFEAFQSAASIVDQRLRRGELAGGSVSCMFIRESFEVAGGRWVYLPHPSGRCRAWNEPGAFDRGRAALELAGVVLSRGRSLPIIVDLPGSSWTAERPARCSNCGERVDGVYCADCGAP